MVEVVVRPIVNRDALRRKSVPDIDVERKERRGPAGKRDGFAAMTLAPSPSVSPRSAVAPAEEDSPSSAEDDDSLSDFSARADRLVARLRRLQRVPLPAPSSGAANRPRPAR